MNKNLGIDIRLTQGAVTTTPSGDIDWVGGSDNLKQALVHRIRTTIGTLFNHPLYGGDIVSAVSRPMTKINIGRIYSAIVAILQQEPRIARVDTLKITPVGKQTIEIELLFTPIKEKTQDNLIMRVAG
jgi:phage baseplate assembly protein W